MLEIAVTPTPFDAAIDSSFDITKHARLKLALLIVMSL
jgi:hypothetical protein